MKFHELKKKQIFNRHFGSAILDFLILKFSMHSHEPICILQLWLLNYNQKFWKSISRKFHEIKKKKIFNRLIGSCDFEFQVTIINFKNPSYKCSWKLNEKFRLVNCYIGSAILFFLIFIRNYNRNFFKPVYTKLYKNFQLSSVIFNPIYWILYFSHYMYNNGIHNILAISEYLRN